MKKWLRKWLGIEGVELSINGYHPGGRFAYRFLHVDGILDKLQGVDDRIYFVNGKLDDLEKYLKIKRVTEKEKTYYRRAGK